MSIPQSRVVGADVSDDGEVVHEGSKHYFVEGVCICHSLAISGCRKIIVEGGEFQGSWLRWLRELERSLTARPRDSRMQSCLSNVVGGFGISEWVWKKVTRLVRIVERRGGCCCFYDSKESLTSKWIIRFGV